MCALKGIQKCHPKSLVCLPPLLQKPSRAEGLTFHSHQLGIFYYSSMILTATKTIVLNVVLKWLRFSLTDLILGY